MRLWGYTKEDIENGRLRGLETKFPKRDVERYLRYWKKNLNLDEIDTNFSVVRRNLIRKMQRKGVPEELIKDVRTIQAGDYYVEDEPPHGK